MPLPLPTLDTRRWVDLVDEARLELPRLAPSWTDYNASDPGITLVELLAWLVEQDVYRTDRVPERHRRAFLELLGIRPEPPRAARVPVAFTLAAGADPQVLPAGTTVAPPGAWLRFSTTARLVVAPVALVAVQSWDGSAFVDATRLWRDRLSLPAFGPEPSGFEDDDEESRPALLLGFDRPFPRRRPISIWLAVEGGAAGASELAAIDAEALAQAAACLPARPGVRCDGEPAPRPAAAGPGPQALTVAWEYHDGSGWRALRANDPTRGLILDGVVRVRVPTSMRAVSVGAVAEPLFYVRCRAAGGRPDETPVLLDVAVNAVEAEQRSPTRETRAIAAGTSVSAAPAVGRRAGLDLAVDGRARVTRLAETTAEVAPQARMLALRPPSSSVDGAVAATLVLVGFGRGTPGQRLTLPSAPVADGELRLWSLEVDGVHQWEQRRTLDAAGRRDRVYVLDAQAGELRFGDGAHGRVPALDAAFLAAFDVTVAGSGNSPAGSGWRLEGADDELNEALLRRPPAEVAAVLAGIEARRPAAGGADAEDVSHAGGRAAEELWAHERLLELAPQVGGTLDGLDPAVVRGRAAPARAVTTLDFDRLALEVPGTRVRRVRAWAGIDPRYPGLRAPGTVTVVVVPGYPSARPEPTDELRSAVRRFLARRKTVGTRLVVVGPDYVEVRVAARVVPTAGADAAAVAAAVRRELERFLDPLRGGPSGRGWPFGRDVYRSEVLALVDGVAGVEHVVDLSLATLEGEARCENVCVGPAQLVVSGPHELEVLA